MQRVQTTVIALVGKGARGLAEAVGAGANARAVLPDREHDPLDRAVEVWAEARRTHTPFLLHDAEGLGPTRRHFYLGYLHRAAPSRVVPARAQPDAVRAAIAGLRAGRWWADLDRLLADVDHGAPDRV